MTSDSELIRRAVNRDNRAFDDLWRRYQARVSRLCGSYLGQADRDLAIEEGDLTNEVFIRVLHQLDRYVDRTSSGVGFEAWLLQVARNVCLRVLEKHRRRRKWLASELEPDSHVSVFPTITGMVETRESLRVAAQAINTLPELYRRPFRLFLEEMSHAEIANRLCITEPAARKRIERARKALQPQLYHLFATEVSSGPGANHSANSNDRPIRAVERALAAIVSDHRIITIRLATGGELQLCLREAPIVQREGEIERLQSDTAGRSRAWKKKLELAEICYHAGRWTEAREAYSEVLAVKPGCAAAAQRLGQLLEASHDYRAAARIYRSAMKQLPQGEPAASDRAGMAARLLAIRGRPVAAVREFRRAISLAPNNREYYYGLFDALGKLSRYEDQIATLEQLRKIDALDAFAMASIYTPCAHLRRFDYVREILEAAVAADPNNPRAVKHLFQARMNLGLRDAVTLGLAERLVELAPDLADSWNELSWIMMELGREDESLALLQRFGDDHPDNVDAHAALSWRHNSLLQTEAQFHHATRAYSLAPHNHHACWTYLVACGKAAIAGLDEFDGLTADLHAHAIACSFPHDAFMLAGLAEHEIRRGRESAALSYALRSVQANPVSREARSSLAEALRGLRRWREAIEQFEILMELPGDCGRYKPVGYLESLRNAADPRAESVLAEMLEKAAACDDDETAAWAYRAAGQPECEAAVLRRLSAKSSTRDHIRRRAEARLQELDSHGAWNCGAELQSGSRP